GGRPGGRRRSGAEAYSRGERRRRTRCSAGSSRGNPSASSDNSTHLETRILLSSRLTPTALTSHGDTLVPSAARLCLGSTHLETRILPSSRLTPTPPTRPRHPPGAPAARPCPGSASAPPTRPPRR